MKSKDLPLHRRYRGEIIWKSISNGTSADPAQNRNHPEKRDKLERIRELVSEVAMFMAYEATRDLN